MLRANVNLAQLEASHIEPAGLPANGTYWLDTADSVWGIFEAIDNKWNAITVNVLDTDENLTPALTTIPAGTSTTISGIATGTG